MKTSRLRPLLIGIMLAGLTAVPLANAGASLVSMGSVWRYLDNGTDPGPAWTSPLFNDSAWKSGPAQLGYGDGDEATLVSFGPDQNNKYITTYFRHAFVVSDGSGWTNLNVWLLVDDGAVVYLNGTEVFRCNLPAGGVAFATLATAVGENSVFDATLAPTQLVTGTNVLAVEVHQNVAMSTDLSFDLELTGQPRGVEPPLCHGVLRFEVYSNIFGPTLASLTNDARFPAQPDFVGPITSFQTPFGLADNYGARVSGFLLPPVTGDYVFYLASDDQGALYLSSDSSPSNKALIAWEPTWAPPGQWIGGGTRTNNANISAPIRLEAGRAYYVEALLKENGGGDALGVAWQLPGQPPPANGSPAIGGEYLATSATGPATNVPPSITQQPASVTLSVGQTAAFTVQATGTLPLGYQWLFNDLAIPGATGSTLIRRAFRLATPAATKSLLRTLLAQ